ncbi:DUF6299 family protein [Streptomyces sp. GDS52]|uniref:DUF6299 family protein n=1 Tax=Streptomyces sp. GDS52 TaxID=3406419 RepID=UPI003FD18F04
MDATGPVFVGSSVHREPATTRYSVGGTRAVCDGGTHRWENTGRVPSGALKAGAADVEATLTELRSVDGLLLPDFHAVERQTVKLVQDRANGSHPPCCRDPEGHRRRFCRGPAWSRVREARHPGGMVSLSHTVVLAPVPRAWFVDALAVLVESAESGRAEEGQMLLPDGRVLSDMRLVEGRHLRPGAVYDVVLDENENGAGDEAGGAEEKRVPGDLGDSLRVTVREWDRRRALRLGIAVSVADVGLVGEGALRSPDRPREAEISGQARIDGVWSALSRPTGRARLRLDDWWTATDTGRAPRSAPLWARLECGAARAELRAVPRPDPVEDRWEVTVTVRIRGRRLFRPVAALALGLGRRRLQRALTDALENLARDWNTEVPRLTAMGRDDIRREILPPA